MRTTVYVVKGYKLTILDGKDLFRGLKVRSIKFIGVDTSKCQNMQGMFLNCQDLKKLDLSKFTIPKVKNLSLMFAGCRSLVSLDIGKATDIHSIYDVIECTSIE